MSLADLGGFFAADLHPPAAEPDRRWRTLRQLLTDPAPVDARVEAVRSRYPAGTDRIAGSVLHLAWCNRLVSPALAVEVLGLGSMSGAAEQVWWQGELSGSFPLSLSLIQSGDWPGLALLELADLFATRYRVPRRSLWGNLAASVNGAAQQLIRIRPALAEPTRRRADAWLADPRLEGGRQRTGPGFRRNSCCLIYQAFRSRTVVCGDCVLR